MYTTRRVFFDSLAITWIAFQPCHRPAALKRNTGLFGAHFHPPATSTTLLSRPSPAGPRSRFTTQEKLQGGPYGFKLRCSSARAGLVEGPSVEILGHRRLESKKTQKNQDNRSQ
jgi:hypothetical protein